MRLHKSDGFAIYISAWQQGLLPDPPLWIDEWASQNMVIPSETGAAESGPYRLDRTPHAGEVMRSLSPGSRCTSVVVRGASQMLKTQVGLNAVCAWIACAPANIIVMEPTDLLARRVASRFDKSAAAVPPVAAVVAPPKSRDKTNRTDTKEFKGGTLWIITAGSISNTKEASARYIWVDEVVDLLKNLKQQGDVIDLVRKRTSSFGRNAKGYFTSSAGVEGNSRITDLVEEGDCRHPLARCPHCQELQVMIWERFIYDIQVGTCWYACVNGCQIEEHHKPTMFAEGLWRATQESNGEVHSYWIPYWYAPLGWDPWIKLAREYEAAKEAHAKGDPEKMQVWMNTRAALDWSPKTTNTTAHDLQAAAISDIAGGYRRGIAPESVLLITAAVDVQSGGNARLEVQIVGWGLGECGLEAWVLNTYVVRGNPTLDAPWKELDQILATPIRHAGGGLMVIRVICVDASDGNHTHEIYEYCRHRRRRWVGSKEQNILAVKGHHRPSKPIISSKPSIVDVNYRGRYVPNGAELWLIGTDTAKNWIFNRLELEKLHAIHFPKDWPVEYFQQILSETRTVVRKKGQKITMYEHDKRVPNEMLDTLVYARAGAAWLGLDNYTAEDWARLRREMAQMDVLMEALPVDPIELRDDSGVAAAPELPPLPVDGGANFDFTIPE